MLTLPILQSCSKENPARQEEGDPGTLAVSIEEIAFEEEVELTNRAATPFFTNEVLEDNQHHTIDLGDDLLMVTDLIREKSDSKNTSSKGSIKDGTKAVADTSNVATGIRYRVLVYNTTTGAYVDERTYIRRQESNTPAWLLPSGVPYTFIVYSINSTEDNLPAVIPAATAQRTLSNTQINVNGSSDYMYFTRNLTLTPNTTTNLNIILKHRFSQITTVVDATAAAYPVVLLTSNFDTHNTNSLVNLNNGSFVRDGQNAPLTVNFPNLNTQTVTSTPNIINVAGTQAIRYVVNSLRVGTISRFDLNPIETFTVQQGFRYRLLIKVVPNDQYIANHNGQPAARINGQIWMRHNVGVPTGIDPDVVGQAIHGDYYQWGRADRSASGTGNTANPFRSPNNMLQPTWNLGSESNPSKGTSDPCPENYRIPTLMEQQRLTEASSTTASNVGTFVTSRNANSNFTVAKVLTSVRNGNVKLTFPIQGYQNTAQSPGPYDNRGIFDRASVGRYWNSFLPNNQTSYLLLQSGNVAIDFHTTTANSRIFSQPIRCIAISQ